MPIRETFWNIPHWAEIGQYILGAVTILVFVYGVIRRVRRWHLARPVRRTDRLGIRIRFVITQALAQARTAQDPYAGVMHLSIFWGMVVLFLGTILATVDWDVTHLLFGFQFLQDGVYTLYELSLDLLGLFVLLGLVLAATRRYLLRPARLNARGVVSNTARWTFSWDDAYALVLLGFIALSGYVIEALRISVTHPTWASWSPVGNAIALRLGGLSEASARIVHLSLWIAHALAAFVLMASVPFTKLFHIVAAPINIFFQSLEPNGKLAAPQAGTAAGVTLWRDFSWKQVLEFEACTRCGRCQDQCPAYVSGQSLSPRNLMIKLEAAVWSRDGGASLHGSTVGSDELWACTSCRACSQICPVFNDPLASIVDLRRHLVIKGQMDGKLQDALANLGRYGNSFGQPERSRAKWAQAVEPKIKDARREPVEYLWFVGDYASYHAGLGEITRQTASVLRGSGLDFGILYEGERNAGNDVRRIGEEGLFEMLAEKNLASLQKCKFQTLVTTDPHSYNTLKNEYPNRAQGTWSVVHYAQLLEELISSGQLKLTKKLGYRVTYHDPCYLGRYNGVYDAPRRVIAATGCQLVEMPRHGDRAYCCGAGGGRIWMEEGTMRERPSESRVREALHLDGVTVFVTTCPKDNTMYRDALKTVDAEKQLAVRDLIELVHEAL
jgi:Fe-S oxidoreductase/nitrate reductase gamma subunit